MTEAINLPTLELTDEDLEFISKATANFPDELSTGHEPEAVGWIEDRFEETYARTPASIVEFASALLEHRVEGLVVKGLDVSGKVPATPDQYQPVEAADILEVDYAQVLLSSAIGRIFGSAHVRGGRLISDVFPKPGFEAKPDSAFGSNVVFDYHADLTAQPDTRPDYFSLNCLRNPDEVPTNVSFVDIQSLSTSTREVLERKAFRLFRESVVDIDQSVVLPILIPNGTGKPILNYAGKAKTLIEGPDGDKSYEDALEELEAQITANALAVSLSPGDILFVNNATTVHGRPAFMDNDRAQEERRWLRRVYIASAPGLALRATGSPTEFYDRITQNRALIDQNNTLC